MAEDYKVPMDDIGEEFEPVCADMCAYGVCCYCVQAVPYIELIDSYDVYIGSKLL